jgi:soluble lytic murein transglycosylase
MGYHETMMAMLFFFFSSLFSSERLNAFARDESASSIVQEPLLSPLLPSLSEALRWQTGELFAYLNTADLDHQKCLNSPQWKSCLSQDIFEVRTTKANQSQDQVQKYIREFSKVSGIKKMGKAAALSTNWSCASSAPEGYALALSLEKEFPHPEAKLWAMELHKLIRECEDFAFKDEAMIRVALLYMLKEDCLKAIEFLTQVSHQDLILRDRSLYLRWVCQDPLARDKKYLLSLNPIPLGMYGHILLQGDEFPSKEEVWRIQVRGENKEYSQLLNALSFYLQNGEKEKLKWIASNIDTRRLAQKESAQFQATIALLFHKVGLDLPVFKILHQVLARQPQLASVDLLPLMFPVRYWEIIQESAGHDLDPILLKSLIRQESAFAIHAQSHARAIGLMQIIPSTAKRLGVRNSNRLMDPKTNVSVGVRYFRQLVSQFGSIELALAAYNAGPKRVKEWQKRYQTSNPDLFVELIPYRETREYVRLIRRNEAIYRRILTSSK